MNSKYSDDLCEWLSELGYKKCFFVAGGNIMHLLESASKVFECVPFVHEVAAGIAAEYHNEGISNQEGRAFVLVTAGPGLTNLVTAISGSFLESRDLLVIGGQVKSLDLKKESMRQKGIQEIDGVSLVQSITKETLQVHSPLPKESVVNAINCGLQRRKGPVFLEICLDVQGGPSKIYSTIGKVQKSKHADHQSSRIAVNLEKISEILSGSERPVLLLGGEISRTAMSELKILIKDYQIPLMTTWNAADRVPYEQENFFGRPDTWGMRYSNLLLQQSDLLIALGARLSLQQTGFNYNEFVPKGRIIHIYSDESEFDKGISNVVLNVKGDADWYLEALLKMNAKQSPRWLHWMNFCKQIKLQLPLVEECNTSFDNFWNPYEFYSELSNIIICGETLIPSSSGGAETVAMQSFKQKEGVRVITSSSLASMGYGLAGAIGAALHSREKVCLVEGDGGFAQNMQELGTAERQKLNLKIFIFCNEGYASIRMTQRNYFSGNYLGCDKSTGLGLPDWGRLFDSFGIRWMNLEVGKKIDEQAGDLWSSDGLAGFLVPIHPEQTYFPKITSRVLDNGLMESNPLHEMTPELDSETRSRVIKYL